MKLQNYYKLLFFLLFISGSMYFTSCIDKNVDLDNVSGDILLGGKLEGPLIRESEIKMSDLLETYNSDITDMHITVDELTGDIILTYDTVFTYNMNEINNLFEILNGKMFNFGMNDIFGDKSITDLLQIGAQTLPVGMDFRNDDTVDFDMSTSLGNDLQNKQRISRIQFENTDIDVIISTTSFNIIGNDVLNIVLKTSDNDSLTITSQDIKNGIKTFQYRGNNKFEIKNQFVARFEVKGDDHTVIAADSKLNLTLKFRQGNDFRYIVYGWFDYKFDDVTSIKTRDFITNIYDFIPKGSRFNLEDPRFDFQTESNLGVPLNFKLDGIKSFLRNMDGVSGDINTFSPTKDVNFPIRGASILGEVAHTDNTNGFKSINRQFFQEYGGENISDYITSRLDSLTFSYQLSTTPGKDINNPTLPEEFIPSDGKLDIRGRFTTPFAFDKGSFISYSDTIKDIGFTDDYFDDISSFELSVTFTNNCPLGFFVKLFLLNDKYEKISTDPYQTITIERPEVYTEEGPNKGKVIREKVKEMAPFYIEFKAGEPTAITELKNAKHILLEYQSDKNLDDNTNPIRLTKDDSIKVKIGFILNGKILINLND
ncbi:MAG: hypothetical protein FWD60_03945 [Candidatus Azobacteroides sp.]|nr:hypothetical protein [Candidatus Azobacteroides sp.]